jgi:caffeoyl-CoA O-methyltransferase
MRRWSIAAVLAVLLVPACTGQRRGGFRGGSSLESPPQANSEGEKKILGVIDQARSNGEVYLEVPATDGRMLRLLTEAVGAKNVVEVGTSTGYSGMWLCLALQKTGGHLTTFEYDAGRAARARKHFEQAGVDKMVTIIQGDAHQNIAQAKGPIDVVFIDADKEGYVDYLNKLLPLVRPGGLILAHNIESAQDYVQAVNANPALDTLFYTPGGGLGITIKKR